MSTATSARSGEPSEHVRVLLNPCGSAGDLHPYLAIGRRLQSLGHEVMLLSNPLHQHKVETEGIPFVPIGEKLNWSEVCRAPELQRPGSAWQEVMRWVAQDTMRATYTAIRDLSEVDSVVVVAPVWSFGARIAREKLNIPLVNLILNSVVLRSAIAPPRTPQMFLPWWIPGWAVRIQYWFGDYLVIDPVIGGEIRTFRKELGLPSVSRRWMQDWWFSPDLVLGLFHEGLVPKQSDWPCPIQLVGHTLWDPEGDPLVANQVHAFLNSQESTLCFVPGSIGAPAEIMEQVAQACERIGWSCLQLHSSFENVRIDSGGKWCQASYVPLSQVLPKCRAILHCGCIGTAAQALRAGIPHFVWPRVNDQMDNAKRLANKGVALILRRKDLIGERLARKMFSFLRRPDLGQHCHLAAQDIQRYQAIETISRSVVDLAQARTNQKRIASDGESPKPESSRTEILKNVPKQIGDP